MNFSTVLLHTVRSDNVLRQVEWDRKDYLQLFYRILGLKNIVEFHFVKVNSWGLPHRKNSKDDSYFLGKEVKKGEPRQTSRIVHWGRKQKEP